VSSRVSGDQQLFSVLGRFTACWRNHRTSEISLDPLRWGLIPHCNDPSAAPYRGPFYGDGFGTPGHDPLG
jgi:hypothetical protein